MESHLLNKVHNFGIYKKGGKRCILQLDFPGRVILLIQKGHIKKSHPMANLEHYDSEDGLHICLKLKDGEMVFEADNTEEKYTLCCLLGLAMQIGLDGDEDSIDSGHGHGFLSDHHLDNSEVIKDGLLEKKGHTAITTWNKRRIRLTPGELSYFKPGEELALNVIQLWKDNCTLKKHQHNGFTLTIRKRVYSFRTVHDYKATHMTEIARDDWFEAFEKAMSLAPTTSKILDMSVFSDNITLRHHHHHHNDTMSSMESNTSRRSSNSSNCSNSSMCYSSIKDKRDQHVYDSTPDVLEQFMAASCQYTQPMPKSLRGNTLPTIPMRSKSATTAPILWPSPSPSPKPNRHILAFLKRSQSSEDLLDTPSITTTTTPTTANPIFPPASKLNNVRRQSQEFHGLSPLQAEKTKASLEDQQRTEPILTSSASTSDLLESSNDNKKDLDQIFSGTAAEFRAKLAEKGGKSSSLKNYRARKEMKLSNSNNNYQMDGVKRGVCKAYNMFLVGADFRARSLDRNPNTSRSIPAQFHPILESKTSAASSASSSDTSLSQENILTTNIDSRHNDNFIFRKKTSTTKQPPSPLARSLENNLHPSKNVQAIFPDSDDNQSLLYSDVEPLSILDFPRHNTAEYFETEKRPTELSTFCSSSLMPSTEAATLLIRDKPKLDITTPCDSGTTISPDLENSNDLTISNNPSTTYSEVNISPSHTSSCMPATSPNQTFPEFIITSQETITFPGLCATITSPNPTAMTSSEPLTTSTTAETITTTQTTIVAISNKPSSNNNTENPKNIPPLPVGPPTLSRQNKGNKKKGNKPIVPPPAPPAPSVIQATPSPCAPPPPPAPTTDHDVVPGVSNVTDIDSTINTQSSKSQGLKLKQIHWTKVGNNQLTSSLWKDVNDVTDKLDLTELQEQFAVVNSKSNVAKNNNQQEKQMLVDAKRAQNLGILFCGLKLEAIQRLLDALNSTTELDAFTADRLATLKRYQPTTEELEMYRGYSKKGESLHDVDKFMVELCEIPKLGLRLDMVLTLWEFPGQYAALEEELTDILTASNQLLDSLALAKVLQYILAIGNVMNSTWGSKQDAGGFQLSSLDKILSVKGKDSKCTLCGYLVKQLKRNDVALLSWPETVEGVAKCSGYSTKAVGAEIDVLKHDLQKIKRSLKAIRHLPSLERGFLVDVQTFIFEHDKKLDQLESKYTKVSEKYKQLLLRFGEPSTNSTESIFSIVGGFVEQFNHAKLEQDV